MLTCSQPPAPGGPQKAQRPRSKGTQLQAHPDGFLSLLSLSFARTPRLSPLHPEVRVKERSGREVQSALLRSPALGPRISLARLTHTVVDRQVGDSRAEENTSLQEATTSLQ